MDRGGSTGSALQLLKSTGSAIEWVDPDAVAIGEAKKVMTLEKQTDASYYLTFVADNNTSGTNYEDVFTDAGITYNPVHDHLTITGGVSIGGTLTYEDVTNVDSIGIVTAGKGLRVTEGGLIVTAGISTFGADIRPALNEGTNIGISESLRFNNVYAKKFHGELEGDVGGIGILKYSASFTASAGVAVGIDTFAKASYDAAEYTIYFSNGGNIQSQKVLVMDDNTSVFSNEYALMYNTTQLVNVSAVVDGSNIKLNATPVTGISGATNFTWARVIL